MDPTTLTDQEAITLNIKEALVFMDSVADPTDLYNRANERVVKLAKLANLQTNTDYIEEITLWVLALSIGMPMIRAAAIERSKQDDNPAPTNS